MPLRTIARCLRGTASRFGSCVGKHLLAEGDVKILARPLGMSRRDVAHLEMVDGEPLRQRLRALLERGRGVAGLRGHAAIDGEGKRHEGVTKQDALDVRERQHPFDAPGSLDVQEVRAMAKDLGDDFLPARAMEKRRAGASCNESVPTRRLGMIAHGERP